MRRFTFLKWVNIHEMEEMMIQKGISAKLNKDNQYVVSEDDFEKIKSIPEIWCDLYEE